MIIVILNNIIRIFNKIDIKYIYRYLYINIMIIPIKCFTCGKVLADKYLYFKENVRNMKLKRGLDEDQVEYFTKENTRKTPEGEMMDKLGLNKICCRRHMLTHVDID